MSPVSIYLKSERAENDLVYELTAIDSNCGLDRPLGLFSLRVELCNEHAKNWGTFRLSPGFPQNAKDGAPLCW
jgi:hypothetical protein